MQQRSTAFLGLWFLTGLIAVVLLGYWMSEEQTQIDRLYDIVNFTDLSPTALGTDTAKLDRLVASEHVIAGALWVSVPVGVVAPALGFGFLLACRRVTGRPR